MNKIAQVSKQQLDSIPGLLTPQLRVSLQMAGNVSCICLSKPAGQPEINNNYGLWIGNNKV